MILNVSGPRALWSAPAMLMSNCVRLSGVTWLVLVSAPAKPIRIVCWRLCFGRVLLEDI